MTPAVFSSKKNLVYLGVAAAIFAVGVLFGWVLSEFLNTMTPIKIRDFVFDLQCDVALFLRQILNKFMHVPPAPTWPICR